MKQMALDIGLQTAPSLDSFFAGPNAAAVQHLKLWTAGQMPSPVPTYLWGRVAQANRICSKGSMRRSEIKGFPWAG